MSFIEVIQLVVNLVGMPIAIVSVLFLIRQTRQLDETLRSQVYQGLIDNSLKIDQLLIDNPAFRKYIYGGEPIQDGDPDVDKLMGIMEFMVDIVDNLKVQEKFIPEPLVKGWRNFAQEVLSSPAAERFLQRHGSWYSSGISEREG
jgi:hypothetical protein